MGDRDVAVGIQGFKQFGNALGGHFVGAKIQTVQAQFSFLEEHGGKLLQMLVLKLIVTEIELLQ